MFGRMLLAHLVDAVAELSDLRAVPAVVGRVSMTSLGISCWSSPDMSTKSRDNAGQIGRQYWLIQWPRISARKQPINEVNYRLHFPLFSGYSTRIPKAPTIKPI
jgi:hypothetical protein